MTSAMDCQISEGAGNQTCSLMVIHSIQTISVARSSDRSEGSCENQKNKLKIRALKKARADLLSETRTAPVFVWMRCVRAGGWRSAWREWRTSQATTAEPTPAAAVDSFPLPPRANRVTSQRWGWRWRAGGGGSREAERWLRERMKLWGRRWEGYSAVERRTRARVVPRIQDNHQAWKHTQTLVEKMFNVCMLNTKTRQM